MTDGTGESNLVALTIRRPDDALFRRSQTYLAMARGREVRTADGAKVSAADLLEIKALAKRVEDQRTAITRPINEALREVNALFKPAKDWLAEAETILKGKLLAFQQEQQRIAREAQARADEETRKERERLERRAALADLVGRDERAEQLREQAESRAAPVVKPAIPKLEGVHTREIWKAEVTDKMAFLRHVVEQGPELAALVSLDQAALNARARSLKDALDLPGIRAVEESTMAARKGH